MAMTLKSYLWGMRISAILSFAAWALVLWYVDPEKTGIVGQLLFYLSTLLFLSGLLVIFFSWIYKKSEDEEDVAFAYLGMSFRQGVLMALLIVALLILQQYRVLTWWDGVLIAAGIFLIELYFLTRE